MNVNGSPFTLDINDLARRGARQKLDELIAEKAQLEKMLGTPQPPPTLDEVIHGKTTRTKQPHWTQTPEGRKRIGEAVKKSWRRKKRAHREATSA